MFKISDPCCFTTMHIKPNIILLFIYYFFSWYNTCFQSCLASHKGLCCRAVFYQSELYNLQITKGENDTAFEMC